MTTSGDKPASPRPEPPRRYPPGPPVMPHRKNAAEWVMWAVLVPAAWISRLFTFVSLRRRG